jgi:hypothetical protein
MWTTPVVSELPRRTVGFVPRVALAAMTLGLICATVKTDREVTISMAKPPEAAVRLDAGVQAVPVQLDLEPIDRDDYDVGIAERWAGWETTLFVERRGKVIYRWEGSLETPLEIIDDVLYYSSHSPIASGATIVAVDLRTGKVLWKNSLRGLGPIAHSQYRNQVWMQVGSDVVAVQGEESAGNYVELVDRKTGKTLANVRRTP